MVEPMSRDMMRGLKAKTEEDARREKIKQIVIGIYYNAVQLAKSKTETCYNYPLPRAPAYQFQSPVETVVTDPFYTSNIPHILAGLQELFPGCYVKHTLLSKGTDGNMYDISKLDEKVLPFVNRALDEFHIVIDWS